MAAWGEVEGEGDGPALVRLGMQALVEGRFRAAEAHAARAAAVLPADARPGLLTAAVRREQGRTAEAEVLLRSLVAAHPASVQAVALLAAVLADLGRDTEAERLLAAISNDPSPWVAALAAEACAALDRPGPAEMLLATLADLAHVGEPARFGPQGSLSRHLGLLCHVLGRWDEAEAHLDAAVAANLAAGAPVLAAHARRQLSALLRARPPAQGAARARPPARGAAGDWEWAVELLADAAAAYRRLEIEPLAEGAELILRRCHEPGPPGTTAGGTFRRSRSRSRNGDGWEVGFAGSRAELGPSPGLAHIAALLAAGRRPVHVDDLLAAAGGVDQAVQAEEAFTCRLAHLASQAADPVAGALARAEQDLLDAELALLRSRAPDASPGDRARRLVAISIRTSLDDLEVALPPLGRHLRRAVRTGTFCLYDPDRPEPWGL